MSVSVMKKLTVLASARDTDGLVRRLMRLRCAELTTVPLDDLPDGGTLIRYDCDTARVEAERRVAEVTAAIPVMDAYTAKAMPWNHKPVTVTTEEFHASGRYDRARETVAEVLALEEERETAMAEYNRLQGVLRSLTPWAEYPLPLEGEGTDLTEVWMGVLPPKTLLSTADDALSELHAGVEEINRDEEGVYVSVLLLKEDGDAVARALTGVGFTRLSFKGLPAPAEPPRENHRVCQKKLDELDNRLQICSDRLRGLSDRLPEVKVLFDLDKTALTAAAQKQKLATTEHCVVLEAWVPAERDARVAAALDRFPCAYGLTEPAEGEEPPVLLKNNGFASNFEWVVSMYSYPKYGTFDPTFVMSIFYFIIFGLMFADVGYGVLVTLIGFLAPKLLHLKPSMTRMLNMFAYCGISCTVFGFVFGGWFGDLPYALLTSFGGFETVEAAKEAYPIFNGLVISLGGDPISLNPLDNPMAFLVISLARGAVHLIAGMAVKFVLLCKEGDVFAAIFDIGSYWILFAGIGLIFLSPTAGWITVGVAVLMILATYGRAQKNPVMRVVMGFKGLYDLINYASDLLSYCRILALGLASAVMAQVFNLLATMGGPTPVGFVLLVAVLLVGHVLNIAINLLGAFVHTSRLQYLEFFGKFFEDGGVGFDPALPSNEYSTVEADSPEEEAETVSQNQQ